MKILIATGIYPPEIGGPATFVHEFVRFLYTSGQAEPVVVTYGDLKTRGGEGWPVIVISRTGGSFVRYVRYIWNIFRAARQVDIVFLQGSVSEGLPGTIGALLAGKKTVMRVPGDYAWEMFQQLPDRPQEFLDDFVTHSHTGRIRVLEWIERWTSCRAIRVILPSKYMARMLSHWGVDQARMRVIYSNPEPFAQTTERLVAREQLECGDAKIIFAMARLVPWKGLDFLLEVLRELPSMYQLVVAGDGPLASELQAHAEKNRVASRVRFLGRVNREMMEKWYVAADAFVLASSYEGFPHGVVEAVMKGLPCYVSDRGGNVETKELFPDHVKVLPYRDLQAWVRALRVLSPRVSPFPPRDASEVGREVLRVLKDV